LNSFNASFNILTGSEFENGSRNNEDLRIRIIVCLIS
jgi:hypothetical protein